MSFGGSVAPRAGEFGFALDRAHSFAAATRYRFQHYGKAGLARNCQQLVNRRDWVERAGDGRHVRIAGDMTRGRLRPQLFHRFGGGSYKRDSRSLTSARKRSIFGEEAVAGMYGVASGVARGADDFVDYQIAFARGSGANWIGLIGEPDVKRSTVHVAVDGHGAHAHVATGAHDAHGNFAAIGDQYLAEHAGPFEVGDKGRGARGMMLASWQPANERL